MVPAKITRFRSRVAVVVAAAVAVFGVARLYGAVTYQHLYSFEVDANGYDPGAPLVEGPDGSFYGLTQNSGGVGADACGTAFKISSAGVFTLLHTFTGFEGCSPTGLLLAGNGLFYGTAAFSTSTNGTVFSMTTDGTVNVLHTFSYGDGATLLFGLIEGTDGLFYGTTFEGGDYGAGLAFRIDTSGTLTILHHFGSDADAGRNPSSGLLLGADGAFYGTTMSGGNAGGGTVFRMAVLGGVGAVDYLHNFGIGGASGDTPFGGVVETASGTFYGTTTNASSDALGTVFRLDGSGLQTVHAFSNILADLDGATPHGRLLFATDGHLYGTTLAGGTLSGAGGTVFRVNLPSETLEILHAFDGSDETDTGNYPVAALTQGTDGKIYGTTGGLTMLGNTFFEGTIFSLDLGLSGVALIDLALQPSSVVSGSTSTGTVTLDGAAPVGGVSVTISSDNSIAQVLSPVVVPEGQTSASFTITTTAFAGSPPVLAEISASHGDVTISRTLTVAPVQMASFKVAPASVKGGETSTATVTLAGDAPAGGVLVTITSDKPSAAASTSVLVPQGAATASAPITTFVVTANTNVKFTAADGSVSLTAPLNVKRK